MTTLAEFETMVRNHDLTHMYSDDNRCWRAGTAELDAIRAAAKTLPQADVIRIWNAAVDRKLSESARSSFYWKVQKTA